MFHVSHTFKRYTALESSGKAEKLAVSTDSAPVVPLSDAEIKAATDELNRSTEAISRQIEVLMQQQEGLARLVKTNSKSSGARADLELRQLQKWESNRKNLSTEVNPQCRPRAEICIVLTVYR